MYADEPDLASLRLLLRHRQGLARDVLLRVGIAAQRRALADLAEREPAVDALGDLREDARGVRRDVHAEPRGELRDPLELVGARRLDRAAQPLQAPLEVDERAFALEVARPRQDRGRPSRRRARRTSRSRSSPPPARRARGRSRRRPPRRPRPRAARSNPPPRSPRRSRRPRRRRLRGRSASREGRRHRSLRGRRARASRRAWRPSRRRGRRGPTRRGRPAPPRRRPGHRRRRRSPRRCAARSESRGRRPARARRPARRRARRRRRRRGSRRAAAGRRRARRRPPPAASPGASRAPTRSSFPSAYACSTVSEPESTVTTRPRASRSRRSASSSACSHETSSRPRRRRRCSGPREPVPGAQVRVREAALVADPALVDLRVVAGEDPLDLPLAHGRVDVAADRAEAADRRHVDDLPRPPLEAVLRRQQRADRAELGHVAGERARVGQVLERRDHRQRAAVCGDELAVLRDALAEARAAVAEDAALAVERDRGRDRDRLLEGELLEAHPRVAGAVAEGEVLQRALAALVADRAVERVVDEDELERPVLSRRRLLGRASRLHDHSVLGGERAAGLELRHPLELDEAHAAGADRRAEPRLVAEDGDLDAGGERGLDDARPLRNVYFALVDRHPDQLGAHTRASWPAGVCACWSDGARIPSSDDELPNGQPPCSTWATNSSRHLCR